MKRFKTWLIGFFVLALIIVAFSACELGTSSGSGSEDIAVKGIWRISANTWAEEWDITNKRVVYKSGASIDKLSVVYDAKIVKYTNGHLNASSDTSITPGGSSQGLGYAVIRYTAVDGPGTGTVDKYQIFRWAQNSENPELRDFAQGYKNIGDSWPNDRNQVFDTEKEAEAGATNKNEHFAFASTDASVQQP